MLDAFHSVHNLLGLALKKITKRHAVGVNYGGLSSQILFGSPHCPGT